MAKENSSRVRPNPVTSGEAVTADLIGDLDLIRLEKKIKKTNLTLGQESKQWSSNKLAIGVNMRVTFWRVRLLVLNLL